jgi:DNA-binding transcriptional MerR regulator
VNVRRIKMNPNNNKHFNDEALRINRMLKKENDELKDRISELERKEILYQDWLKEYNNKFAEENDG